MQEVISKCTLLPMWKRCIAVIMSAVLVVGFFPTGAFAAVGDANENASAVTTTQEQQTSKATATSTEKSVTSTQESANTLATLDTTTTSGTATETTDQSTTTTPSQTPSAGSSSTTTTTTTTTVKKDVVGLTCKSYVQGKSKWLSTSMGKTAGVSSGTKGMTALAISKTKSTNVSGNIQYQTYMKGKGWSSTAKNGKQSGNKKTANAIQALKVKLTGDLAKKYDVYYRVNVIGYGWTGWGKNNQAVGAKKLANIRSYQVKLVKKGSKAPGSTSNRYMVKGESSAETFYKQNMKSKAQSKSSKTKYLILVNTSTNRVEILKGKKNKWSVVKYWKCTSGASGTPTVKGNFTIQNKGKSFGGASYTCWYWSQFHGNYLFHSVLYQKGSSSKIRDGRLGIKASHGCVRLAKSNAKWIYNNVPRGTKVYIY